MRRQRARPGGGDEEEEEPSESSSTQGGAQGHQPDAQQCWVPETGNRCRYIADAIHDRTDRYRPVPTGTDRTAAHMAGLPFGA
ncbi:hypothetical protein EYF80_047076 [Liparis tanakae]|uniref:Uncharacterized protein n=1 Tax=Liparis tanakae TaxID=230148 RepID=A0A4Z2FPF9_9TELE|nr:hypothetical protein EYF80_047076 [Liparis tanakae]